MDVDILVLPTCCITIGVHRCTSIDHLIILRCWETVEAYGVPGFARTHVAHFSPVLEFISIYLSIVFLDQMCLVLALLVVELLGLAR